MRAGALRRRITIQQRAPGRDALGQGSDTWTTVCTPWADLEPTVGRETAIAAASISVVSSVIEIRYRTGLTAAMRATYAGRILNIEAVIDVSTQHERLQLVCTEGANQG